jgi:murein DD-endopeptidase MepM/ murein hydrolase activator NlpD
MAQFTDIIKFQRKQGKSAVGALASAVGQKSLEKIDPRNYLFNRKGTMAALFPNLKGFQAKTGSDITRLGSSEGGMSSSQVESMTSKLDVIGSDIKIVAKNSIVLPHLARDLNVVRQNIVKLVKSKKIKPAASADMFFLRAKEREDAYEAQQDKSIFSKKDTPTKIEKKERGGLFDGILNWIMTGAAALVLFNFIGKLINDPEYRAKVWQSFKNLMEKLGIDVDNAIKNIVKVLAVIGGIMLAFQVASSLLVEAIKAAFLRLGKGTGTTTTPDKKPKPGKPGTKTPVPGKGRLGSLFEIGSTAAVVGAGTMLFPGDSSASVAPSSVPSGSMDTSSSPSPAMSTEPTSDGSATGYALPVKAGQISSVLGMRSMGNHKGIDIALPENSDVTAVSEGVVSKVGYDAGGYGNYVYIRHPDGTESRYGHLNKIMAKTDQKVDKNTVIGLSGNTGRSTGPHLHLEMWKNGQLVNPVQVIPELASAGKGTLVSRNESGSRALNLGTATTVASTGTVNYSYDNRQYNTSNQSNGGVNETANASDQLFKMLFMNVS